jgi:hypothetical protein
MELKTLDVSSAGNGHGQQPAQKTEKLLSRFLRWLYPEQRKTIRHSFPPLVSFMGSVLTSIPYRVADVSPAGFYMMTVERWLPGTEFPVTLRKIGRNGIQGLEEITLLSRVIRCGPDGVGFVFAVHGTDSGAAEAEVGIWANERELNQFLEGLAFSDFEAELDRAS